MKLKKILTGITALALGLSAMSISAFATDEVTQYDFWCNGEQFTSDHLVIECGEGTATYVPETKTLLLDDATVTETYNNGGAFVPIAIYFEIDGVTIDISGDVEIPSDKSNLVAICCVDYDYKLTGDGNLSISTDYLGLCDNTVTHNLDLTEYDGTLDIYSTKTGGTSYFAGALAFGSITYPEHHAYVKLGDTKADAVEMTDLPNEQDEFTLKGYFYYERIACDFGDAVDNKDGTHTYTCSECGDTKTEDCTYSEWEVVTPATTEAEGLEKATCTVCGHEITRAIDKLKEESSSEESSSEVDSSSEENSLSVDTSSEVDSLAKEDASSDTQANLSNPKTGAASLATLGLITLLGATALVIRKRK